MGTPIDKSPCGLQCPVCWGVGKPFGDLCTPKYITLIFSDIEKGTLWLPLYPEPPNGCFIVDQAINSCEWRSTVGRFEFYLGFGSGTSSVNVFLDGVFLSFVSYETVCSLSHVSTLTPPVSSVYVSGKAKVILGFE